MNTLASPTNIRYKSLDHWRGVAALAVVVFHGFSAARMAEASVHFSITGLKWVADFGWFGVHLFFVISGYCIIANVTHAIKTGRSPQAFLADRFLRIYPVYWLACLVALSISIVSSPFNHTPLQKALPASGTAFLANLFLLEPYLDVEPYLIVSWTLVFELGFYLIVALGFVLHRAGIKTKWLILAAILLAGVGLAGVHSGILYVLKYWPEFVSGGFVFFALSLKHKFGKRAGLVMIVPVGFTLLGAVTLPDAASKGQMVGTVVFALLLYWLHPYDRRLMEWKGLRWLAWVGTISYSLYLIHSPVGGRIVNLGVRWMKWESISIWLLQILYWVGAVFFSYLFYRFCEIPLEQWRRRLQTRKAFKEASTGLDLVK